MKVRVSDRPYRPLGVKVLNTLGRRLEALGLEPVSLERRTLLRKAAQQAGSDDFGTAAGEQLDVLLRSLEDEARLTMLGRVMAQAYVVTNLANRAQLEAHWKRHPEVAREDIGAPLIIVGLPRTGTTILHALLDQDPSNRSPLSWEVAFPVPPATPEGFRDDPRIARNQAVLDRLFSLAPGFEAMHPMGATMPQECVAIWAMDLASQQFHATFDVPSYETWLDDQPFDATYAFQRRVLQHLQSGGVRGDRWLLKTPGHLHRLEALLREFPDARIIHTHRDPVQVCTSVASLTAKLRGVASDAIDFHAIGKQQLEWWGDLLGRSVEQRARLADRREQFFDVRMSEIVADPIGVVERIYAHFDLPLTDPVRTRMRRFMAENPRDKHGSHTYESFDFGIDPARDRARFRAYTDQFGV